jgi:hypothetical protein
VLAAEVSLQAVLRCRHCSHQFVLGEMVEAELGFWEVVDDPNTPKPKVVDAAEGVDDAALELAKSEEYFSPQMLLKKQAEKENVEWSKFEPITTEQYERMRRKGKSPIWSMLSVLLGGLASIPIATLLIWHVLGKDPLQMGPVVGRYAPWIVPTRFQPNESDFEADNRQPPPAGASGFRRFDSVMNDETTAQRPVITETPGSDVFTIINQVEMDMEAWNERGEDRELHKKLALQTYSNLASLALAIGDLPAASPLQRLVRTELHSVGQQVSQHTDIQHLIQSGSRYWLSSHQDRLVGLAIVINVAMATEVDNAWQLSPAIGDGEESIQITVPKEVFPSLSQGQNIFVIGSLSRMKSVSNSELESSAKSASFLTANYVHMLEPK